MIRYTSRHRKWTVNSTLMEILRWQVMHSILFLNLHIRCIHGDTGIVQALSTLHGGVW